MTPSEKEELLRTISCQGKEYSQCQTDPHLVICRKIRREYLVLGVTYTVTYGNRLDLLITLVRRRSDVCLGRLV